MEGGEGEDGRTGPVGSNDGFGHRHCLYMRPTPPFSSGREDEDVCGLIKGEELEGWGKGFSRKGEREGGRE